MIFRRLTDFIILLVFLSLPVLAILTSCDRSSDPPVVPPDNHAPQAVITVDGDTEGPTPFTVSLDGSGSTDEDGDELEYLWLFSDGESAEGPIVQHEFTFSGRHDIRLLVTDPHGETGDAGPVIVYGYGLANSAWPKFAHDVRNSGVTPNRGPMMNLENADNGGAFPRYWRGGIQNDVINSIVIGYDGVVYYSQGEFLRARTADGSEIWDRNLGSEISSWPAIAHDGSIVTGTLDGMVFRLSSDGEILWDFSTDFITDSKVSLTGAVTIDRNANIYLAGATGYDPQLKVFVIAISLDGEFLWWDPINHSPGEFQPIPAISQEGYIVFNGEPGLAYMPDGTRAAEYHMGSYSVRPRTLGPPSVDGGNILFARKDLPVFSEGGNYLRTLLTNNDFPINQYNSSINYAEPGQRTTAVVGDNTIDIYGTGLESYHDICYLVTRSLYGDVSVLEFPPRAKTERSLGRHFGGATRDSLDRVYVSWFGINCAAPLRSYSVSPYMRRYSLWTYYRPSIRMTPPVIGEDGWLYAGCGLDLLAIGD